MSRSSKRKCAYGTVALVLQGGGALGSYQAGVYEGLHEDGLRPDWVAGISIGAINAAIIAGSPPDERVERLRGFWETICRPYGYESLPWVDWWTGLFPGMPFGSPAAPPPGGENPPPEGQPPAAAAAAAWGLGFGSPWLNGRLAAASALLHGQPGFFKPRFPPPFWQQGIAATSYYDTAPLLDTLRTYVDFDLLNSGSVRASFGAVNVRTGNFSYFDSTQTKLTPQHIMASGALPPGFPAIEIDGEHYWDGGIVSNTPLYYVLSASPMRDTLVFQMDLWPARGPLPANMEEVEERRKDIQYSSRTRLVTDTLKRNIKLREDLQRVLALLPEKQRNAPELAEIRRDAIIPAINVVNLIYESKNYERHSKDYEFGSEAMREHWSSGLADIRATLACPGVLDLPAEGQRFITRDIHRP